MKLLQDSMIVQFKYIIFLYNRMIDVEKKQVKSIDDYRHSIKLLKYHLKKQKKANDKLKYQAAKFKHKPHGLADNRNRVYELNQTVKIISDRLKRMGLLLQDIFRMADSKYEGQITKEQFMRVVGKLKSDLSDSVFNQMFCAIDTSLNNLISQDQFQEFSIAYGGCSDTKIIRKYQNKIKSKLLTLINKQYGTVQSFLSKLEDPIPIDKLRTQLKNMDLNDNEVMTMLKTFDPSHQGFSSHKLFLSVMQQAKVKTQKEQQNQQFTKNVNQLCVIWRNKKVNPLVIFQEADVDGKDGISPFQLQQAFKKVLPDQTPFQIKKWVNMINLDNNSQITRQQFLSAIRGFYSINQINKFSQQYTKKHPQLKIPDDSESAQKIMKQLSFAIEDQGMNREQAFDYIDFNKSKSIDKEELLQGLKNLGINIGLIGKVLAIFDMNGSETIDIDEWYKILGKDPEMSQVGKQQDFNLDSDQQQANKNKQKVKAKNTTSVLKKPQNIKKSQVKQNTKNPQNKDIKKSAIQKKPEQKKVKKQPSQIKKQPSQIKKEPSQIKKEPEIKKTDSNKTSSKAEVKPIDKKQTITSSKAKQNTVQIKKSQTPNQINKKESKVVSNKKFAEDQSHSPTQSLQKKVQKKQSKPAAVEQNKKKLEDSTPKIKKVESKIVQQDYHQQKFEQPQNTDQIEQQIAVRYKQNKKNVTKYFQQFDKKDKGVVNKANFALALKKVDANLSDNQIKQIFMKYVVNGNQFKYKQWLDQISQLYAQDVEQQEQNKQDQIQQQPEPEEDHEQHNQNYDQTMKKQKELKQIQEKKQKEKEKEKEKDKEKTKNSQKIKQKQIKNVQNQKNNESQKKRGEDILAFQVLANTLKTQQGKKIDVGYKLIDYISDQQNILKKKRQQLLNKAKQLKKTGKLFQDKQFPAVAQSIISKKPKNVNISNVSTLTWKHYKQIYKSPVVFHGEIEPNDIKQGNLGNCYFLSALAGLAEYANLIQRLFEYYDVEIGYFLIWLCIDGSWKLVEIDGYLPVRPDGYVAFSHSDDGQLWVSLLEKAYAKCYGDYNKIVGGQPIQAIKDLTGAPGDQFQFKNVPENKIWDIIYEADKNQQIMAAGTKVQQVQAKVEGHDQSVTNTGIVLGHAYSILDCRQVKGQKIIKLRNPWGQVQWTGSDWADKGKKWTQQNKKMLNHKLSQKDGIFWIQLQNFYKNFLAVSVNFIRPTFHYRSDKISKVQQFLVIPTKSFKNAFLMINHLDHRHKQIPINTEYDGLYSLLGFIQSNGKVLEKFDVKNYKYERQGCVRFNDMSKYPEGSKAVMLVSLAKTADVTVGYYGDQQSDFDVQYNCLPYIQKLAYWQQNGPKAKVNEQKNLKIWQAQISGIYFICFMNISTKPLTVNATVKDVKGGIIAPPFGEKNVLKLQPNQTKSIKLKVTQPPISFSFGYGVS